ncbi:hypothetical protein DCS_08186 [Drechmeria coniospora]|uniref:Rab-GAP TBC domain-containing protein n=1 Tax=Drechmeria coniospora TaxID=98403 RepID=A0A151GGI7_DRECN|nr:hypothetical protein DCS_08186 [Drechmeria coniospora]KYK56218.1 hypothetical protein DCS_08186 [Drechmeria coniospora]
MDASSDDSSHVSQPLERSVSQTSAASNRSHSQTTRRSRSRLLSHPSSSSSSVAASDKSLTSFPSFSPEEVVVERFGDAKFQDPEWAADDGRRKPAAQDSRDGRSTEAARNGGGQTLSIVDSLVGPSSSRDALFEDAPLRRSVPGALHQADDPHIQRLVARHGAVALVRQISEDLAQRDTQISMLRRRADERERALRRIIRECGLSNLDLETRLRAVEGELRANDKNHNSGLTDLMSDAMQDTMSENVYGVTNRAAATIRAAAASKAHASEGAGKGTIRGWKSYIWGTGTSNQSSNHTSNQASRRSSINGGDGNQSTVVRSHHANLDRRPTLQEDLFNPPAEPAPEPPPTLTHIYNNYASSEYLTDRFGFIYDQRRKKRQREAAQMAQHMRKGTRVDMLMSGRSANSSNLMDDSVSISSDGRPESPSSMDERQTDEGRPTKRWQDYLKIATVPTELLSHTPSMSVPSLEVMEGATAADDGPSETVKSPGITPTSFGLVPLASTTTAVDSGDARQPPEADGTTAGTLVKEDAEPVRLLLEQLSDVHDSLQRDKMARWNDFLRKVRAERRREGEAAVAAAAAAAEARHETPAMILPEARVADGEIIGIAGLGNKGKVGRAKWAEFKALLLGGIPVAHRAKVWSECSGANGLRNPGYYDGLVGQSGEDDDPAVVGQIRMDMHRTLTDNIFFRKGPGVRKLNEVLLAYSRRNKEVGYCQGMNLIAANLLLITPAAEDAFWILASMIETILPRGYYDHSLMASRADQQVLRQYVSTVLPKLSAHLDDLSIELEALTFQWFLSVFTDCLSAEALFRVWDVVLCTNDGSTFLFQVALALLKLNERNLLRCDTAAGVYTYINHQMTEHAISIDGLIQASEGLRKLVRRDEVEQRRERAMQAERDMQNRRGGRAAAAATTTAAEEPLAAVEPMPMEP